MGMTCKQRHEGGTTTATTTEMYRSEAVVDDYTEEGTRLFPGERKIFQRYFTDSESRVLDLGCGVGRTTRVLADEGFDVVGVDISAEMVERANRVHPDLDVRVGDAADLDFEDESFDYVLFSYTGLDYLHPEENRFRALREIRRVLRPGGLFAFSVQNSFYLLPALLTDWSYIWNYYVSSGNIRRWFERYRIDDDDYGVESYFINPISQLRQLRAVGFDPVACVGDRDNFVRFFELQPYFVARKPDTPGASDRDEATPKVEVVDR